MDDDSLTTSRPRFKRLRRAQTSAPKAEEREVPPVDSVEVADSVRRLSLLFDDMDDKARRPLHCGRPRNLQSTSGKRQTPASSKVQVALSEVRIDGSAPQDAAAEAPAKAPERKSATAGVASARAKLSKTRAKADSPVPRAPRQRLPRQRWVRTTGMGFSKKRGRIVAKIGASPWSFDTKTLLEILRERGAPMPSRPTRRNLLQLAKMWFQAPGQTAPPRPKFARRQSRSSPSSGAPAEDIGLCSMLLRRGVARSFWQFAEPFRGRNTPTHCLGMVCRQTSEAVGMYYTLLSEEELVQEVISRWRVQESGVVSAIAVWRQGLGIRSMLETTTPPVSRQLLN